MPIYKYKAANQKGEVISGTYSARNSEEVVTMMRSNRQFPVEVVQVSRAIRSKNLEFNQKVKVKDLTVFCNQFNTLLKSGVTIIQCIDTFRIQSENKMMRGAFTQVYKDVQTGVMLSEALRPHKKVFPDFLVNMIESGEMSGNLESVTARLAIHYEKENAMYTKVKAAMIYPIVLSVLAVIVVFGLVIFVMPTFISLFTEAGAELPALTSALLVVSDFMINRWYIMALVTGVTVITAPAFLGSPAGKLMMDRVALNLPVVKTITSKVSASRFARTLSTLLYSGVPLMQALEITAKIVGNKVYENALVRACDDVKKGSDLSTPIEISGLFPAILCNMIRIGEASGRLDESLERAADLYDMEVDDAVGRLSSVLEPLMIVFMAVVIGTVVIAIAMPMFGMYENINF